MKAICLIILGLAVFTLVGSGLVFAISCGSDMSAPKAAVDSSAVNVGNKICPVLGEPIDEANKATYEYKGKVYNFCCAMCVDTFKKEPQKYIDKVNQELEATKAKSVD
jgi:YHS domain-containing protein